MLNRHGPNVSDSQWFARRTKEIGIRMALGASAAGVVGLILKQSMRLCAIGLGIGLTLAVGRVPARR